MIPFAMFWALLGAGHPANAGAGVELVLIAGAEALVPGLLSRARPEPAAASEVVPA
jgi:hypothetical protein